MKNTDPTSDSPSSNSAPENLIAAGDPILSMQKKLDQDESLHKKEIDLNELFPETEINLNELFPEVEVKHLLKRIMKNKNDMNLIKERLSTENETLD